ncbi:hypothetical protein PFICI_06817 [Pestalotiopsis fici W106-1]|uniref:Uncharacterized protein n=1 Tax=Pestalotiopsis fici (strain W106-1 / CGMCC3.15140) TaxID=1229662 RepID=W3X6Z0_PESFW|nr:uncharacterized protein PFICI_06817 [Pestalotiopsis fici W106-1]ETS81815.1 hypothetical protein PFICI_06817 [Pestalotiopsis fici W106-1]
MVTTTTDQRLADSKISELVRQGEFSFNLAIQAAPSQDIEHIATAFFLKSYVPISSFSAILLSPSNELSELRSDALKAASLAYLSIFVAPSSYSPVLKWATASKYGIALSHTNHSLMYSGSAIQDDTLLAVLLLALSEAFSVQGSAQAVASQYNIVAGIYACSQVTIRNTYDATFPQPKPVFPDNTSTIRKLILGGPNPRSDDYGAPFVQKNNTRDCLRDLGRYASSVGMLKGRGGLGFNGTSLAMANGLSRKLGILLVLTAFISSHAYYGTDTKMECASGNRGDRNAREAFRPSRLAPFMSRILKTMRIEQSFDKLQGFIT